MAETKAPKQEFLPGQMADGSFLLIDDFEAWKAERDADEATDPDELEDLDQYDDLLKAPEGPAKDGVNTTAAAFTRAIKLDRLQYLRGVRQVRFVPDFDKWNAQYDPVSNTAIFQDKFQDFLLEDKVNVILHEAAHRGQYSDPRTYQAYLDAGLNKLSSFLKMANCVHIKDWQENGIERRAMAEEEFAESYSRFCLGWEMPDELRQFWQRRVTAERGAAR